jgi:hypothetical protein
MSKQSSFYCDPKDTTGCQSGLQEGAWAFAIHTKNVYTNHV